MGRSLVAGGISGLPVGESWQEIGRCAQEGQALGWTRSNLTGLVLKKRLANMLRGGGVA